MKKLFTFLLMLSALSVNVFSQVVGDYQSVASGNWGAYATVWVKCVTNGTWAGATPATAIPTNATNVYIRSGHTITYETTNKFCLNLTIDNGGTLISNGTNIGSSGQKVLRFYGTSIVNNGTIGNSGGTDGLRVDCYGSSAITISGSGVMKVAKLNPVGVVPELKISTNLFVTYQAGTTSSGSGLQITNSAGVFSLITVDAGASITFGDYTGFYTTSSTNTDGALSFVVNVAGTITCGANGTIQLRTDAAHTGAFNVLSTGTLYVGNAFTNTSSTANNNTNITLTIASGGKIVGGTGVIDFAKSTTIINGVFDLGNSATSVRNLGTTTVSSTGTLRLKDGTWPTIGANSITGSITLNSGSTVEYYTPTVASTYTLPASPANYSNLLISNTSGVTLGGNTTVTGALTLSGGNITTGANSLTLSATGSVTSGRVGYINGTFSKVLPPGSPSMIFEVGDGNSYAPVSAVFYNVDPANTGSVSVKTVAGDHPNILTAGINSSKSVNRYWTITNNSANFDEYSATFNFVNGDVDAGAATNSFIVKNYDNLSVWNSQIVGTKTTTSTSVSGVTSFGDFVIGEAATSNPAISISGALTAFGNVATGSSSEEQSYSVAGVNLTADISIVPPTGFEISTGTGTSFVPTNPLILPHTSGTVASTIIYVRFSPGTTGAFSGNIVHTSTTASQNFTVSGYGISVQPTTQASSVVFGNNPGLPTSITVSWTNGNGTNRLVVARAGSAVTSNPSNGTSYTANTVFGSGSAIGSGPGYVVYAGSGSSVDVTGLTEGSIYYFSVYEFNGSGGTENYLLTPATGIRGANIILSNGSGNWSAAASWLGSVVPTATDNVKIASSSTITVDVATAACKNILFNSSTSSKLAFAAGSVLNVYGDFTTLGANLIPTWTAGAKLKFTGAAATQIIGGLSVSKTSTSQLPFMEVVVDKSAGKVTTQGGDFTFLLGTSLEIINGTFELGATDDIEAVAGDMTTATTPTITVQSGGVFTMLGGDSHICSGLAASTLPIGKLTINGTANLGSNTSTTKGVNFNNVDVNAGGTLNLTNTWGTTKLFNPGTLTIQTNGKLGINTSENIWNSTAVLTANSGSTIEITSASNYFPITAQFTDLGTIAYAAASGDQTVYDRAYNNLELRSAGNKNWTMSGSRTNANVKVENGAILNLLTSSTAHNLTVSTALNLNGGLIVLGANNLVLASGASITGTPSATNMIDASGSGSVYKSIANSTVLPYSYTFPIGNNGSTPVYSPVTVTVNAGSVLSTAQVGVNLAAAKHPSNTSGTDFLNRYWTVTASGITTPSYDLTFSYTEADVSVPAHEANLHGGVYDGAAWTLLGLVNAGTHQLLVTGISTLGSFTAGESGSFSSVTPVVITLVPQGYSANPSTNAALLASPGETFTIHFADPVSLVDVESHQATLTLGTTSIQAAANFALLTTGTYYIYITHPNTMTTWSREGGETITTGSAFNYDFTSAKTQAYGGNLIQNATTGAWCVFSGDVDGSEFIDNNDLLLIDNDAFRFVSGASITDLDGTRFVDNNDLLICDNNAYNFVGVKKPSAVKAAVTPITTGTVKAQANKVQD